MTLSIVQDFEDRGKAFILLMPVKITRRGQKKKQASQLSN